MPSLLEHQIHQSVIYTSNRRHSIHINKNSSIGLKKLFTVWCLNNRRRSACTIKLCHSRRSPMLVYLRNRSADISLLHKLRWYLL